VEEPSDSQLKGLQSQGNKGGGVRYRLILTTLLFRKIQTIGLRTVAIEIPRKEEESLAVDRAITFVSGLLKGTPRNHFGARSGSCKRSANTENFFGSGAGFNTGKGWRQTPEGFQGGEVLKELFLREKIKSGMIGGMVQGIPCMACSFREDSACMKKCRREPRIERLAIQGGVRGRGDRGGRWWGEGRGKVGGGGGATANAAKWKGSIMVG